MIKPVPPSLAPKRILYTMIRVSQLERSIAFYRDALGMQEVRRETFPDGQFTLVFLGYGETDGNALIELTYNWGDHTYQHGTGYGHIAFEVEDIHALQSHLESQDIEILRPAGPMTFAPEETGEKEIIAFLADPDGYRIELIQAP